MKRRFLGIPCTPLPVSKSQKVLILLCLAYVEALALLFVAAIGCTPLGGLYNCSL